MAYSLFHTLNISKQDMMSRMLDLDSISNNLANINTNGFRGSRQNFQELLSSQHYEGTSLVSTQLSMTQGVLQVTESPFDWAIQGDGYFPVKMADGKIAYTRDGQFHLDANRELVNASGCRLVWNGQVPDGVTDMSVDTNGNVFAILSNGSRSQAGTLQLAQFANPTALVSVGDNALLPSDASGQAQLGAPGTSGLGTVTTHAVERSNVNAVDEMTHMIGVQRGFQLSTRIFQQTDLMIGEALHLRKV